MSTATPPEIDSGTTTAGQGQKHSTVDPATGRAFEVLMPSEVSAPTRSDSEPQQASTQPGDGGKSHAVESSPVEEVQSSASKIPWKDQVLGYAKVSRGKMLRKQNTVDEGNKILQGEIVPQETRKSSNP